MAFAPLMMLMTEGAAGMSAVGIMQAVGTAMSVVGAVTGNKDLLKLGGLVGLGGAIGGMMSGAAGAAAGAATDTAGASATEAASADIGAANAVTDAATESASGAAAPTDAGTAMNNPNAYTMPGADAPQSAVTSANVGTTGQVLDSGPGAAGAPAGVQGPSGPADVTAPAGVDGPKGSDFFSKTMNFLGDKNNKTLIDIGGGILKGINENDQFDQRIGIAKTQNELAQAKFDYEKQLNANVNNQNQSRSGMIQKAQA